MSNGGSSRACARGLARGVRDANPVRGAAESHPDAAPSRHGSPSTAPSTRARLDQRLLRRTYATRAFAKGWWGALHKKVLIDLHLELVLPG